MILDAYVGSKLRQLRRNRMARLEHVSNALDIGPEVLFQYEVGQQRIPAQLLFELAHLFDVRMAYFFDGFEAAMARAQAPRAQKTER